MYRLFHQFRGMLRDYWERLPWYLKNRYAITTGVFAIWMMFFDQHNMINQIELRAELYQLDSDREYYQLEIISIHEDLEELLSDNSKLEKFAREKYFMKRPNEEIFIFVDEE
ncbi:MAG: septum formation initiator family protein [Flavobacteriales bacterium]|nr:septum formation initiator family protein [Flavobacteriales bacterium]